MASLMNQAWFTRLSHGHEYSTTVVEEHGSLRSYTIHYKSVCNTIQVYKHVSVNLVIHIHYVQLAQCALRYIT